MTALSEYTDRLAALKACHTPQEAFDFFALRMVEFGFSGVFAGRISLALLQDLSPDPFAFVNANPEYIIHYLRAGMLANDPVVAYARSSNRPFRWRDAFVDITPEQQSVADSFTVQGLPHGLCIPIDRVRGVQGVACLGRGSDFSLSASELLQVEMYARTLFETCDRLFATSDQRTVTLTQRERDVLSLVAEGKTNWEVGQILGVSEYSVRDYLRVLSKRLMTTNRTHTVVRAIQLGLIAI